jgi:hypothetical protein
MSETLPIADAMEEAAAVLGPNVHGLGPDTDGGPNPHYQEPAAPVQVPLFEPPPFDFEEAYDELHRLDQRAKNRKSAWESLKGATRDAKEDYDSAINDLHDKFDEIDSARRVAAAVRQPMTTTPTEEEVMPMPENLDETIDETPEESPPPADAPTDETSSDAPVD